MPRPVTILSLPAPLLERILTHAAHGRRGKLPFATWSTLPAVHPAFRAAFYAAVSRVALADAYAVSAAHYPTLASYTHAARRILAGPLLRCGRLRDLDLNACDALTDEDVAAFAARAPPLASFTVTVCRGQTDAAVLALARASPRLRAADVSGCDRHRHSAALLAAGGPAPRAVPRADKLVACRSGHVLSRPALAHRVKRAARHGHGAAGAGCASRAGRRGASAPAGDH
jgi:hypothetical protein